MDKFTNLKELLDFHANLKNCDENLFAKADPLQVAKLHNDDIIALICALFAYGNANLILKFLNSLDFSLLNAGESTIKKELKNHKYRFQNSQDMAEIFITLRRLKNEISIQECVLKGLSQKGEIIDGINLLISQIYKLNSYKSPGYEFFFGRNFTDKPVSPYKRYNLFLRWAVRKSDIDLGFYEKISQRDLLIPLDVHTHRVSLNLGLIERKSYDFEAVNLLTKALRKFDKNDPIKYDFALYRLGQSGEFKDIKV